MAKRKKTNNQLAFDKEVRRIKNFIRRAEKRGYRFRKEEISELIKRPSRITKKTLEKVQNIKPITLYKRATALSESGQIVSGLERRREERRESARKAARTRRDQFTGDFEKSRRLADSKEKARLKEERYKQLFNIGQIVYRRVLEMIHSVGREHARSARKLESILSAQIENYGYDLVMRSMAQNESEILESAEIALLYGPGHSTHEAAIRNFALLITGEIPDFETASSLQDAMDYDAMEE